MTAYRRRPVVVEAIQWTGDNLDEVREWLGEVDHLEVWPYRSLWVVFLNDEQVVANPTDYLVRDERGVHRETAEALAAGYEVIEEDDPREGLPLRRGG